MTYSSLMNFVSLFTTYDGLEQKPVQFKYDSNAYGCQILIEATKNLGIPINSSLELYLYSGVSLMQPVHYFDTLNMHNAKDGMTLKVQAKNVSNLTYSDLSKYLIDVNVYKKAHTLSKGTTANTYSIRDKELSKIYAVKVYSIDFTDVKLQQNFLHFISQSLAVNHPAIIHFKGFSWMNPTAIIEDFMKNGSLADALDHEIEFTNIQKQKMIFGIASGLNFLHENQTSHQNLKPSNVLLDANYEPAIADIIFKTENEISSESNRECMYEAPEIIDDQELTEKIDIFSYGMICFAILTGKSPFDTKAKTFKIQQAIVSGKHPKIPDDIPQSFSTLIKQCWQLDPASRPSMNDVVASLKDESFLLSPDISEEYHEYINRIQVYSVNAPTIMKIDKADSQPVKKQDPAAETQKEHANPFDDNHISDIPQISLNTPPIGAINPPPAMPLQQNPPLPNPTNLPLPNPTNLPLPNPTSPPLPAQVNFPMPRQHTPTLPPAPPDDILPMLQTNQFAFRSGSIGLPPAGLPPPGSISSSQIPLPSGVAPPPPQSVKPFVMPKPAIFDSPPSSLNLSSQPKVDSNDERSNSFRPDLVISNIHPPLNLPSPPDKFESPSSLGMSVIISKSHDPKQNHVIEDDDYSSSLQISMVSPPQIVRPLDILPPPEFEDDDEIQDDLNMSLILPPKIKTMNKPSPKAEKTAEEILKEKADNNNDPEAQDQYGMKLMTGDGVPKDQTKGLEYLRRSSNAQYPAGMFHYGSALLEGDGCDVDEDTGFSLIVNSCNKNYSEAQAFMGISYKFQENYKEAFRLFTNASNQGDPQGKYELAVMYYDGKGTNVNKLAASKLFKEAADKGIQEAKIRYGSMCFEGDGIAKNLKDAYTYIKDSYDSNYPNSVFYYGKLVYKGCGSYMESMPHDGVALIKQACDKDVIEAKYYYGLILLKDKTFKNEELGLQYVKEASDREFPDALVMYGDFIYNGHKGLKKNEQLGLQMIKKGADSGSAKGCYLYGIKIRRNPIEFETSLKYLKKGADSFEINSLIEYGKTCITATGLFRDIPQGIKYLEKACEMENANAYFTYGQFLVGKIQSQLQTNLEKGVEYLRKAFELGNEEAGILLVKVLHGPPFGRHEEANEVMEKISNNGNSKAQYHLGYSLFTGTYNRKNVTDGIMWLTRAAEQDFPLALDLLGQIYYKGIGVPKNMVLSEQYFSRAVKFEISHSCYFYAKILFKQKNFEEAKKYFELSLDQSNPKMFNKCKAWLKKCEKHLK